MVAHFTRNEEDRVQFSKWAYFVLYVLVRNYFIKSMKVCIRCTLEKSKDEFHKGQPYCKSCKKEIDAKSHAKHRDRRLQKRNSDRAEYRKWLISLKEGKKCTDCGQSHPHWRLQWDHLPDYKKDFEIGKCRLRSKESVLAEITKCELVCANCHCDRTYHRRNTPAEL